MKPVLGHGKVSSGEVEGFNTKAKLTSENRMVFEPSKFRKLRTIIHLVIYPPPI